MARSTIHRAAIKANSARSTATASSGRSSQGTSKKANSVNSTGTGKTRNEATIQGSSQPMILAITGTFKAKPADNVQIVNTKVVNTPTTIAVTAPDAVSTTVLAKLTMIEVAMALSGIESPTVSTESLTSTNASESTTTVTTISSPPIGPKGWHAHNPTPTPRAKALLIANSRPSFIFPLSTNPADNNPPNRTLFIGNSPPSLSIRELKRLCTTMPGYDAHSFTKKSKWILLVSFTTMEQSAAARVALDGYRMGCTPKGWGGLRISYAKNSIGERSENDPPRGFSFDRSVGLFVPDAAVVPIPVVAPVVTPVVEVVESADELVRLPPVPLFCPTEADYNAIGRCGPVTHPDCLTEADDNAIERCVPVATPETPPEVNLALCMSVPGRVVSRKPDGTPVVTPKVPRFVTAYREGEAMEIWALTEKQQMALVCNRCAELLEEENEVVVVKKPVVRKVKEAVTAPKLVFKRFGPCGLGLEVVGMIVDGVEVPI